MVIGSAIDPEPTKHSANTNQNRMDGEGTLTFSCWASLWEDASWGGWQLSCPTRREEEVQEYVYPEEAEPSEKETHPGDEIETSALSCTWCSTSGFFFFKSVLNQPGYTEFSVIWDQIGTNEDSGNLSLRSEHLV